jgi:hypothetical protein
MQPTNLKLRNAQKGFGPAQQLSGSASCGGPSAVLTFCCLQDLFLQQPYYNSADTPAKFSTYSVWPTFPLLLRPQHSFY